MSGGPAQIGGYRIVKPLGAGGMGVVYLARDDHATLVALKTVLRVDAQMLHQLRREIHALRRIEHPGVIRVLSAGVHDALPWYAMELLEDANLSGFNHELSPRESAGSAATPDTPPAARRVVDDPASLPGTVRDLPGSPPTVVDLPAAAARAGAAAAGARRHPPRPRRTAAGGRLRETLTVFRRLCLPLGYCHGEGLVHCDLKPDNVYLRPDGVVVLADFGLITTVGGVSGREALEVEGGIRGTPAYMAPELFRAEHADARADLYALGCMLYESVVGQPPFRGSVANVATSHLTVAPTPPSTLVDGVAPELDALVLRLLAKERNHRLGYAGDVAVALVGLGADPTDPVPSPPARPYVYRSELVGRDRELGTAGDLLRSSREGAGLTLLVGGESGVGKTRFASELGLRAVRLGTTVITGQCLNQTDAASPEFGMPLHPFRPFLQAVTDRCRAGGSEVTAELLGDRRRVLAAYEPSLGQLPAAAGEEPPGQLEGEAARRRLFRFLTDTLVAFAAAKPLLLLLDDLQWADELTLAYLRSPQRRALGSHRVMIVATYRTEEVDEGLLALIDSDDAAGLTLERLGEVHVGSMVSDMLALREPPAGFVQFLAAESEGNPFFVAEYLRTAVVERVLDRAADGTWRLVLEVDAPAAAYRSLPLPGSLRELIGLRLAGLSETASDVVAMAAVLGREFDPEVIDEGLGLAAELGLDAVQELRARQVVEYAADGRLRFLHDKLREIPYTELDDDRRRELHRRAAAALAARRPGADALAWHAELGRHFALGELPREAVPHLRAAADLAAADYANDQALGHLAAALDLVGRILAAEAAPAAEWRDVQAALHERRGDLLQVTGSWAESRGQYARALAGLASGDPVRVAALHRKIGADWQRDHHPEEAERALAAAAAALGEPPSVEDDRWHQEWLQVQIETMWVHYWEGRSEALGDLFRAAEPVARRFATPAQRVQYFTVRSSLELRTERYAVSDPTERHTRELLAASEELGEMSQICIGRFTLAFVLLLRGELEEAGDLLRSVLDLARRTGEELHRTVALVYLTLLARRRGDVAGVRARAAPALAAAGAVSRPEYQGQVRGCLAWACLQEGDLDDAEKQGNAALDHWAGLDAYPFQWTARLPLAAVHLARGRVPEALAAARAMLEPAQMRLADAVAGPLAAALAADDPAAARERLEAALAGARAAGLL
jgi:serine/threonine protein kinase